MLVYDILSIESFDQVKIEFEKLYNIKDKQDRHGHVVLVGNKTNLSNPYGPNTELTLQNTQDLVYGYMREAELLCNSYTTIIPEDIKAICLSYHGEPYRKVTYEMGENLAKSWQFFNFSATFIETSAKTGENVEEAFYQLVRLSRTYNYKGS